MAILINIDNESPAHYVSRPSLSERRQLVVGEHVSVHFCADFPQGFARAVIEITGWGGSPYTRSYWGKTLQLGHRVEFGPEHIVAITYRRIDPDVKRVCDACEREFKPGTSMPRSINGVMGYFCSNACGIWLENVASGNVSPRARLEHLAQVQLDLHSRNMGGNLKFFLGWLSSAADTRKLPIESMTPEDFDATATAVWRRWQRGRKGA